MPIARSLPVEWSKKESVYKYLDLEAFSGALRGTSRLLVGCSVVGEMPIHLIKPKRLETK